MSFFYIGSMLPTTEVGWVCSALCQWSTGEAPSSFSEARTTMRRATKHTLSSKCEPRVNFCWFLVGFRVGRVEKWSRVETNSGVGRDVWPSLKQSHKSADWHGEREGGRVEDRGKEVPQRNLKWDNSNITLKILSPINILIIIVWFFFFPSSFLSHLWRRMNPRPQFTCVSFVILMLFGHFSRYADQ